MFVHACVCVYVCICILRDNEAIGELCDTNEEELYVHSRVTAVCYFSGDCL